jgi:membrane protein implicated in regulation of membrane protease activity
MNPKIATCFAILLGVLMLVYGLTAVSLAFLGYSLGIAYVFVALAVLSALLFWKVVNSVEYR